ncbi:hypothetical protein J1605_000406 [Eschrichtius robustus]|uniref:Uncharacterized protein n=1 Tax=Eschrichtius robustus TaxID=9764 RepID=A0AB34HBM5_ESCRO|nr:hypothetical protein J1605_000406 [Eschrichtius robustus]
MEEGLITLNELHRATKEVYRKQIKVLNDNLERKNQRWLGSLMWGSEPSLQWVDFCSIIVLQFTSFRENEINEFLAQIEQLTLELKQEEEEFVAKEKKLIRELSKYEVNFILRLRIILDALLSLKQRFAEETQINKEKEGELVECLPQLQVAEEEYMDKNRQFENLVDILTGTYEALIELYAIIVGFMFEQNKEKQELKQLRDHESHKIKAHFEVLKHLENEIYVHDLKTDDLLLENKRLKEQAHAFNFQHIAYIKSSTEQHKKGGEDLMCTSSDLSSQLTALQSK